ncbi:MAG: carbon-nitrogen hydrolase family protein [Thermoanaerobacteraceae bacterium]|nr:carbon-nitrogen hydrolase family protein [Thermoanaerobacteraceae bacterium]
MKETIIAGVQIASVPNNPEKNIDKILKWLNKAVDECNPDLVVFPETVTTGFATGLTKEELWDLVDTVPGRLTEQVSREAQRLKVHVVFPTYTRGPKRGDVYNSAILIDNNGDIVGIYNKTHIFPPERKWVLPGETADVFETPFAKIGIIICFDGDFPELSRVLAMKGAEIIVRPSAFLRSFELWKLTNCARAFDNHVYLIGVNAVGTDAEENYYFGNSMIVSPIAQQLALATAGETIISAKLDPNPLQYLSYGIKKPMVYNHMENRNVKVYEGILNEAKSQFPLSDMYYKNQRGG